ncbi:hypothetical protein E1B28_012617 [Marasmius oreades]|uniref:Uncharacterized protein n=1 Tax=Marasmius oreades TaxID=181124 RepID=A0A9P7RSN2_9AGAR|nr:uncharacterized protein E1B28_012617 [Marasmius oreades]KAG7088645.1 hypothetical protein E1B28_012617 [Marasmius oreades]
MSKNILAWDQQIMSPITHLQLNGHICKPPPAGTPQDIYNTPVYPPIVPSPGSTDIEMEEYTTWRENDHAVWQILMYQISNNIRTSLLGPLTAGHITMARELYETIHGNWGLSSPVGAMVTKDLLYLMKAIELSDVDTYVLNYRTQVSVLAQSMIVDWPHVLHHFANGLLDMYTYSQLHTMILTAASTLGCSKDTFEHLARSVMDVTVNQQHRLGPGVRKPAQATATTQNQPVCDGCGGIGRTKDQCQKCNSSLTLSPSAVTTSRMTSTQLPPPPPPNITQKPVCSQIAAVATPAIKEINVYAACLISPENGSDLLDSSPDAHPLSTLLHKDPGVFQVLAQEFSVVLHSSVIVGAFGSVQHHLYQVGL